MTIVDHWEVGVCDMALLYNTGHLLNSLIAVHPHPTRLRNVHKAVLIEQLNDVQEYAAIRDTAKAVLRWVRAGQQQPVLKAFNPQRPLPGATSRVLVT